MAGYPYTLTGMSTTKRRIANRVRGVASEYGFTQQQIADALGISRTSVVERMNGRIAFSAAELVDLASAMQIPVGRFYPDVEVAAVEDTALAEGGDAA